MVEEHHEGDQRASGGYTAHPLGEPTHDGGIMAVEPEIFGHFENVQIGPELPQAYDRYQAAQGQNRDGAD
jgi:hypothetical protein